MTEHEARRVAVKYFPLSVHQQLRSIAPLCLQDRDS